MQALTQANARACHNGLAKVKCFVAARIFLLPGAQMLRKPRLLAGVGAASVVGPGNGACAMPALPEAETQAMSPGWRVCATVIQGGALV